MSAKAVRLEKSSKFNINTCRLCLSQSPKFNKDLSSALEDNENSPLIYEALEYVMDEKIIEMDGLPLSICGACQGLLTIAYDLKTQYFKSKEKLLSSLKNPPQNKFYGDKKHFYDGERNMKSVAPQKNIRNNKQLPVVELISGDHTYSIEDIVVVDDPPVENKKVFQGFINNLGTVISGSFSGTHTVDTEKYPEIDPKVEIIPVSDNTNIDNALDPIESETEVSECINVCQHCKRSFSSKSYLQQHIPICELFKKLQCYICKEKKGSRKRLILHLKNKHSIGKDLEVYPEDKETVECKICFKICVSKDSLRYHMLRHTGPQYPCEECGKTFASPYYTKRHVQHVHKRETLEVCPICAKSFTFSGGLRYHMKLHNKQYKKEAVEVCPFCAKTFHYQGGLAYHIKTHTKDYNFKCSFCDKRSGSRSAIKRHERTHTGDKPYPCRFCQMPFREDTHRNNHEKSIHTGERPYKCEYCDAGFVVKDKMKHHMLTHDGPHKCEKCGKGFVSSTILSFHLKRKHGIKYEDQEIEIEIEEMAVQESDEEFDDDDDIE